ncbi:MAG: cystathionine gamma-synthase family protein [Fibrobacterota bacterium]|nr:MAG: cystathionine gamma-synthase family protein [Fibrobacterota bacterium]
MRKNGFTTTNLHLERWALPEHGALRKPIHTSIAFGFEKAEDLAAVFQSRQKGFAYSRQANPTVQAVEQKITAMEGGTGSVCFSTGMAALGAIFFALLKRDDHIVASQYLFGNTASMLSTLEQLGVEVSFVDATEVANVEAALTEKTRLVLVETIANPVTQIADLARIGDLCKARKLLYVVDNTMTSPWLFQPKSVHATFSVNSLSKYFGGHGAALGGSVTDCGGTDWTDDPGIYEAYKATTPVEQWGLIQVRRKGLRDFGGTLSPEAAHTLSLGSETMALRMERACDNAAKVARFLEEQKAVVEVNHPSLLRHPQSGLAAKLFRRPGALLSFALDDRHDPLAFMSQMKVVVNSTNLGDTRTLGIAVAPTIFYELGRERRAEMGIREGLIRLSVGIEDVEDLIADFQQALNQLEG